MTALVGIFILALPSLLHLPGSTGFPRPSVVLSAPTVNNDAVIAVATMTEAMSPTRFRVNVVFNGSIGMAGLMPTTNNGTVRIQFEFVAGLNVTVRWADVDGDGNLSPHDYFTVSRPGGLPRPGIYEFYLIWEDGLLLASAEFTTSLA